MTLIFSANFENALDSPGTWVSNGPAITFPTDVARPNAEAGFYTLRISVSGAADPARLATPVQTAAAPARCRAYCYASVAVASGRYGEFWLADSFTSGAGPSTIVGRFRVFEDGAGTLTIRIQHGGGTTNLLTLQANNTWYKLEFRNVDYVNFVFDAYVDDRALATGLAFVNNTATARQSGFEVQDVPTGLNKFQWDLLKMEDFTNEPAAPTIHVDWNNDLDFADAEEDITADVMEARWDRGREAGIGITPAGTLELRVHDPDGDYSPENTATRFGNGNVKVGRHVNVKMQVNLTSYQQWYGRIEKIIPHPEPDVLEAYIYCVDALDDLAHTLIKIPSDASAPYNALMLKNLGWGNDPAGGTAPITAILDDVSFSASKRTLDKGSDLLPFWWANDKSALDALQDIEKQEQARIYIDEDGKFTYEDRGHRYTSAHATSVASFTDSQNVKIDYDHSARPIINSAKATVQVRREVLDRTLFSLSAPLQIPASGSKSFEADFSRPATTVNAPSSPNDYLVSPNESGTGAGVDTDVTVALTVRAEGAKVTITNAATSPRYIVKGLGGAIFSITGKSLETDPVTYEASDATSQTAHGIRRAGFDLPFEHANDGDSLVRNIVSLYKNPSTQYAKVKVIGAGQTLQTLILARKISDRVTLTSSKLGISSVEYFINAIEHSLREGGTYHEAVFSLEKADIATPWLLGVANRGELGTNTTLGW